MNEQGKGVMKSGGQERKGGKDTEKQECRGRNTLGQTVAADDGEARIVMEYDGELWKVTKRER